MKEVRERGNGTMTLTHRVRAKYLKVVMEVYGKIIKFGIVLMSCDDTII